MPEQRDTPTLTHIGSLAMDLGITASRTQPNYPSLRRRSVQTRWILGRSGLIWKKIRQFAIMLVSEQVIVVVRFIDWDLHGSLIMARPAIKLRRSPCLLQWKLLVSILVYTAARESVIQIKIFIERENWLIKSGMEHTLWVDQFRSRRYCSSLVRNFQQCWGQYSLDC